MFGDCYIQKGENFTMVANFLELHVQSYRHLICCYVLGEELTVYLVKL